ncbi:hypothetical protein [Nostoc sp. PCC 7107]|uniref:hypothetical protein n=1 Tax=Nostoc sp. PCC 7107 TaxID=317936 RepID=UPI00029EFAC8|nr:hypothetical protein [Nostoc sp. PCC 7107]AFY43656.1 hypothetical protein Nos7107_3065 [Nostoc sp. PCC 7107]
MIKTSLRIWLDDGSHLIKGLFLQALPQKGDRFDIQGKTGIPQAFCYFESYDDDTTWTVVVKSVEHSYDMEFQEHSITIHADFDWELNGFESRY